METPINMDSAHDAVVADDGSRATSWVTWTGRLLSIIGSVFGFGDEIISIITASAIVPKRLRWLWPNRIPLGKLTLFVGDPDNGKSMAATYVAAKVTSGGRWFGGEQGQSSGEVLILANEDDLQDTAVPRLMAAGADLSKVNFARMVQPDSNPTQNEREVQLDRDLAALRKLLADHPRIRLVTIDPVSNYLGGTKMTDEQAVRRVLTPLNALAAESGVAILGIMHLNKKADLSAINRVGGAMAFVGVARAVWLFATDDEQKDVFHMLRLKQNISARTGGLTYRIATKPVQVEGELVPEPYIEWLGETEKSAGSLLTPNPVGRPSTERQSAAIWLKGFLASGRQPSTVIEARSKEAGIAPRTLDRAKDDLCVNVTRDGEHWYCELPGSANPPKP